MISEDLLNKALEESSYVCSICNTKIYPTITKINEDSIDISINVGSLRGGYGNQLLEDNICQKCLDYRNPWNNAVSYFK